MNTNNVLLIIVAIMVIQRYLETFTRRAKEKGIIKHRWTFIAMFLLHNLVLIGTVAEYYLTKRNINLTIAIVGLGLYLIGLLLRNWSIKTLGRFWSIHIEIREAHYLIKNGPYKFLRHPAYIAIACEVLGFPLILNAINTFYFALIFYIPILLIREYYEEIEMMKKFGDNFHEYRRHTFAFSNFFLMGMK